MVVEEITEMIVVMIDTEMTVMVRVEEMIVMVKTDMVKTDMVKTDMVRTDMVKMTVTAGMTVSCETIDITKTVTRMNAERKERETGMREMKAEMAMKLGTDQHHRKTLIGVMDPPTACHLILSTLASDLPSALMPVSLDEEESGHTPIHLQSQLSKVNRTFLRGQTTLR